MTRPTDDWNDLEKRLEERVEALAQLSDGAGPGVTRLAFSELEREAHRLVASWAQTSGAARVEQDTAGNTVLVYKEGTPYFMVGSHVDSVSNGGRFDGVIGVLAALEVAAVTASKLEHGLRVVVFSAEEGARFGTPCIGSSLATGQLSRTSLGSLKERSGETAIDVAARVGLDLANCEPWVTAPAVRGFLELHIEQGSLLETEKIKLGVVDVVAGVARLDLELTGRAEHSGATPMRHRADALAAMSEIVLAVEEVGNATRNGTATIGHIDVEPNGTTTIAGLTGAIVDIRNVDVGRQRDAVEATKAATYRVAERRAIRGTATELAWRDPVMLSAWVRRALGTACQNREEPYRTMSSGPGHDAAVVAQRVPAGILFVATPGGRSHVPDEGCRIGDVALACHIFHDALLILDAEASAERRLVDGLNSS